MNTERFSEITSRYASLRLAIVGDFCLDRYLEIDPARQEMSIETGLPVYNVVNIRSQPGAAGTILNNLVALGIGEVYPVGFCGEDGEGFELRRSFLVRRGVKLDYFIQTDLRRTFTYCKPLVLAPGKSPVELNRLDSKNWNPTPSLLQGLLISRLQRVCQFVDAVVLLDQVAIPETGVVTQRLLAAVRDITEGDPSLLVLADSRRGLRGYPPVTFKMNAAELSALVGAKAKLGLDEIGTTAAALAQEQGCVVFVTLAELGLLAAAPTGAVEHVPALPLRGAIDIVGAGDAVTANLAAALAAGATVKEAITLANVAASIAIHQLGTTGAATVAQIAELLLQRS
ncbi:MAG TPA: PfkB family carbohydrate kinase [Candidatus Binatia bacterium]|nr:PfkB family carbohydrate kinase [Candidatus Binatia bacterium]